ncbi:MAG: class I SAM-dependent methyltransferase [Pseudomonadota bacterium]
MPNQTNNRTNEFLEAAYSLESDGDMQDFYSEWATEYDTQMEKELSYLSPSITAKLLVQHQPDRDSSLLDVGCGTGLTSVPLAAVGYATIDGLDFSQAMLDQASARGFYRHLFQADLNKPLAIDTNSYDGAVCSGTFTHAHIGAEPLDEIFRVIKPGGHLVCTIHTHVWESGGFANKIAQLCESGTIVEVERLQDAYFQGGEREGYFCVLKKC